MSAHLFLGGAINVLLSGVRKEVNLWTECGSPTTAVNVICTIASGSIIYGETLPALLVPSNFVVACGISIMVFGGIYGFGGDGGDGGDYDANGHRGKEGGSAISTFRPVSIGAANGFIFGGGGGGRGGSGWNTGIPWNWRIGGGGGGGGQGYVGGRHGDYGLSDISHSANGTAGTFSAPGRGGNGANEAESGKNGFSWGNYNASWQTQSYAVDTNGQGAGVITWIDGYNSDHVKGKVG